MEGKEYREILNTPIEKYYRMDLISVRAYNCCLYNDIVTIGDIATFHRNKGLLSIRNCGKKILEELEGLLVGIDFCKADLALKHPGRYAFVPDEIKTIIEKKTCLTFCESPDALYCFYCVDQNNLAERFCGLKSREEKQYYYQTLLEICSEMKNTDFTVSYDYELFVVAKAILWFCNDQFSIEIEESDPSVKLKKAILLVGFTNKASNLSIRAKKIQEEKIPTYLQAASLFQLSKKQFEAIITPGRHMVQTNTKLYAFIESLKEELFQYDNLDNNELVKQIVIKEYPFLSDEQIAFVVDYNIQYGHYPMFYILRHYLLMSKNREDVVFAMSTGMLDGRCKTLEEIGDHFDLTRERIRQVLVKASKKLFDDKEWEKYPFMGVDQITRDDELFLDVVNKERIDVSFESFAQICFRGLHFKIVKEKGTVYLRR